MGSTDPVLLSGANELRLCMGVPGQKNAGRVAHRGCSSFFSGWEISKGVCIRREVGAGRHDGLNLHSLAKQEYLSTD